MKIFVTGGDGQLGMSLRKIAGEYPRHTFIFTDLPQADITDRGAMERLVAGSTAAGEIERVQNLDNIKALAAYRREGGTEKTGGEYGSDSARMRHTADTHIDRLRLRGRWQQAPHGVRPPRSAERLWPHQV